MNTTKTIVAISFMIIIVIVSSCRNNSFTMSSGAMEPTIKNGEIIYADLNIFKEQLPNRWDIVIFHSPTMPNTDWLMRIVGLPGETVSYDSLGLLINGERMSNDKNRIHYKLYCLNVDSSRIIQHPYIVPEDQYYLLGDNVDDSFDSRVWGSISKDKIFGLVKKQ
ncbi:MAG: signal peptidase I [Melioribacteraceae bacterium]|nr:signal peptidase I [Melioribacteraceae bacterium]